MLDVILNMFTYQINQISMLNVKSNYRSYIMLCHIIDKYNILVCTIEFNINEDEQQSVRWSVGTKFNV